jgi:hypothetical protein
MRGLLVRIDAELGCKAVGQERGALFVFETAKQLIEQLLSGRDSIDDSARLELDRSFRVIEGEGF